MKVTGPGGVSGSAPASKKAGASGGAFSLPSAAAAGQSATAAPVSGPSALMGVESLLALQDAGGPLEGRRRSMRRAVRLLDVLDDLKVALIDGMLQPDQIRALSLAIAEQRATTGEPALEAVLDEIETRAAVELAKLEVLGFRS